MLISLKHNFVFICIPKCASTSIEDMLQPHCEISLRNPPQLKHTSYRKYHQYLRPFLDDLTGKKRFETICIIRDPLSWLNSWYRYRSRDKITDPAHPNHINNTASVTFSEFVDAFISPNPPPYATFRKQYDFIQNDDGNTGIDKIFLYENLDLFIDYLSQKIGTGLVMPKKNISPLIHKKNKSIRLNHILNAGNSNHKDNNQISDRLLLRLKKYLSREYNLYHSLVINTSQ